MVEVVVACALTSVMATHSWQHNNQLTRVCEYRCSREVSSYYYYYPKHVFVPWDSHCPAQAQMKIRKLKPKR